MEQTLRNLIADGNTKKALSILRGLQTLDKAWRNKIIMLNTRYANYETDSMNTRANRSTLQAELMTLNGALLTLIDDLETEGSLEAAASEQESQLARAEKNIIDNINKQTDTQNQFLLTQIAALMHQKQAEGNPEHAAHIQHLEQERAQLLNERDNALTQARELAAKLLVFDPEQASEEAKHAHALFLEGKLPEAYAALDEAKMQERAKAAQNLLQQAVSDYMQKGKLAIANSKYDDAERLYTEGVRLDSTNVDNLWTLALFLSDQNENLKAITYYERALSLSKTDELIGTFCNNLGEVYRVLNKMPEAEKYYLQSLDIYARLALSNPQQFEPDLATTAMNLGNYYYTVNKMPEAEKYYLQSLDIRARLALSNPQQFEPDLGLTQYNLGLFYRDQKDNAKAETYLTNALAIYEKWEKVSPLVFGKNRKKMWRVVKDFYEEMLAAATSSTEKTAIEKKLKALLARE